MPQDAIVLFAHGSQDPEWAAPFQRIKGVVQRERPDMVVEIAFLEIMQPTLLKVVDQLHGEGVRHITVIPVFIAPGAHVSRDLPQIMTHTRRMYPSLTIRLLPSLGEVDALIEAIGMWVASKTRGKARPQGTG